MDAAVEIPRRHWAPADINSPTGRLTFAALRAFRAAIGEGRYTARAHLEARMDERDLNLADVLDCIERGRICTIGCRRGWLEGAYLLGDTLVIVGAAWPPDTDFGDLVPEIDTVYEIDPIEPQPLRVQMEELAQLRLSR
jgi:hypothetical protein